MSRTSHQGKQQKLNNKIIYDRSAPPFAPFTFQMNGSKKT